MNNFVVGRHKQIQELKAALDSPKPEMVALVGRRRVGKTYLVRSFFGKKINFELTGLQNGNKRDQLQHFIYELGDYFPAFQDKERPKSWTDAFRELIKALSSLNQKEKLVVFLDELPWLASKRSGFITGLGYFWNSWASRNNIVLVVCGSAASWMIKKIINDKGGLHNRVTRLLYLYPFTLAETEEYCRRQNIKLNRYQLLQIYMTMGGIPMYLDQLKPGRSAVQNIQEVCFDSSGYLRNEFERLYASLFNNYKNHISVIRAMASRRIGLTRQEIIKQTELSNGGSLTEILDELEKSGFILAYSGYGKKVKEVLFRVSDFYSLFYLTFIEPLGKGSQVDFTALSDLPKWKAWSGYSFENICLTHVNQIRKALSIAGVASSVSSFIAAPKDGLKGAQIDLIIDRNDQTINICEIKFSVAAYQVSKKDVDNISNKKQVFRYHTKTKKHLFTTFITTMGVIENAHKINHVDQVVTMDDLFEP